jgi:hypothetical protein
MEYGGRWRWRCRASTSTGATGFHKLEAPRAPSSARGTRDTGHGASSDKPGDIDIPIGGQAHLARCVGVPWCVVAGAGGARYAQ